MTSSQNLIQFFKRKFVWVVFALYLIALPVQAHHPWEGQSDSFTLYQGLFSGLAHPILGLDHLLFLVSIGLVAGATMIYWVPSLLAVGLVGSLLAQGIPSMPGSELLMGLSLVASAYVVIDVLKPGFLIPLIFCHGFVLGQTVVGVEPTPLIAYWFGLLISESFLIIAGIYIIRKFNDHRRILAGILIGAGLSIGFADLFGLG